jgi:uncharacterized protein (DUF3820 family)
VTTNSRHIKPSARLDFLSMPIGKFRGMPIRDLPDIAPEYSDWLAAQPWFKQRYVDESLALARAIKVWANPAHRHRIAEERRRAFESREAERLARQEHREQEWLNRHKVAYDGRGIMPFGKYSGQPLAIVARDTAYCRWFAGSAYARMNPELAADLMNATGLVEVSAERLDSGCTVYKPQVWCRAVRHPEPPEAA